MAFRKSSDFNGPCFLDDYCAARKIDRIDFLKIDTQGYESRVLAGAGRMLAAHAIGCWAEVAPGVGFEPTTDRLTVDCSTAELPRNNAYRLAVRAGYNDPLPSVKAFFAQPTSVRPGSSISTRENVMGRWRPNRESNSGTRICSPLHSHSAIRPAR